MNCKEKTAAEADRLVNVLDGQWGTIGPRFWQANKALADAAGCGWALTVFSASAALETLLRAHNIGRGCEVLTAAWSDPVDAMTVAAVGAVPVFADVDPVTLTLTPETLHPRLTDRTRAVIADLPGGTPCDAAALEVFCRERGLLFFLNASDGWGARLLGKPVWSYADAAFVDLGTGRFPDVGLCGAVLTDREEHYQLYYAYHNCGRPIGDGATLAFDAIIGGDLRVAEWQAALLPARLAALPDVLDDCRRMRDRLAAVADPLPPVEGGACAPFAVAVRRQDDALLDAGWQPAPLYPFMADCPFWQDAYCQKLTGGVTPGSREEYPVSASAADEVRLWRWEESK